MQIANWRNAHNFLLGPWACLNWSTNERIQCCGMNANSEKNPNFSGKCLFYWNSEILIPISPRNASVAERVQLFLLDEPTPCISRRSRVSSALNYTYCVVLWYIAWYWIALYRFANLRCFEMNAILHSALQPWWAARNHFQCIHFKIQIQIR